MSILRDGWPDVHSNPLEPPSDLDSLVLPWDDDGDESDMLDDVLGDLPAPCEPRLPFAEWVAAQAAWFRSQGTPAADWLAKEVDQLAKLAASVNALNPAQLEGRRAALDAGRDEDLRAEGFARGVAHCDPKWHYTN